MMKKKYIFSKFNILLGITFGFYCIQQTNVNATSSIVPLWDPLVCQWALSQCRQDENSFPPAPSNRCRNFDRTVQPYLCAGGDGETGLTDCRKAMKIKKSDPCAVGYKVCLSNSFKK